MLYKSIDNKENKIFNYFEDEINAWTIGFNPEDNVYDYFLIEFIAPFIGST